MHSIVLIRNIFQLVCINILNYEVCNENFILNYINYNSIILNLQTVVRTTTPILIKIKNYEVLHIYAYGQNSRVHTHSTVMKFYKYRSLVVMIFLFEHL